MIETKTKKKCAKKKINVNNNDDDKNINGNNNNDDNETEGTKEDKFKDMHKPSITLPLTFYPLLPQKTPT